MIAGQERIQVYRYHRPRVERPQRGIIVRDITLQRRLAPSRRIVPARLSARGQLREERLALGLVQSGRSVERGGKVLDVSLGSGRRVGHVEVVDAMDGPGVRRGDVDGPIGGPPGEFLLGERESALQKCYVPGDLDVRVDHLQLCVSYGSSRSLKLGLASHSLAQTWAAESG
jgi:hypothetical protein